MKNKIYIAIEILLISVFIGLVFRWVNIRAESTKGYIAIVIDDFGNNSEGTEEMLELPIKFTGAVMPFMPNSEEEAERLAAMGKEAILHQPMEAHTGKRSWLGPVPILGNMSVEEVKNRFCQNADSIKTSGFNNHMGSLITEDREKMRAIMECAKERNMYFLDSVTSSKSVAQSEAERAGIKYFKRDVFLDSTQDIAKIKANILKTATIAEERGYAIAIGHVGAEGGEVTAKALRDTIDELKGFKFVTLSELGELVF